MPKMDVPKFDGEHPKLWQVQCEDYFEMYNTAPKLWVRLASLQFSGPAARWLSSVQSSIRKFTWSEFSQEVVLRFGRNQHQSLIRRLYKLVQTGSVEDYVHQFAEIMDQLSAYEEQPDTLHYVTRFIDGLKPEVRVLVAVQLPQDLQTAYTIACVQEEVGGGLISSTPIVATQHKRHFPAVAPQVKPVEERRAIEYPKPAVSNYSPDDKLSALKNYRRAKGLCFTCGERWFKDHKCQATVQLHVVQEMVEFLSPSPASSVDLTDNSDDMELMHIDDIALEDPVPEQSIVLQCTIQGNPVTFLLDSGSNNSFLSKTVAANLTGRVPLTTPRRVKVAGGGILLCETAIPSCKWKCGTMEFCTSFKILPLQGYDGIVGMDWLSSHSPQIVDWKEKWLAFQV
jgi:hypothetical protein